MRHEWSRDRDEEDAKTEIVPGTRAKIDKMRSAQNEDERKCVPRGNEEIHSSDRKVVEH